MGFIDYLYGAPEVGPCDGLVGFDASMCNLNQWLMENFGEEEGWYIGAAGVATAAVMVGYAVWQRRDRLWSRCQEAAEKGAEQVGEALIDTLEEFIAKGIESFTKILGDLNKTQAENADKFLRSVNKGQWNDVSKALGVIGNNKDMSRAVSNIRAALKSGSTDKILKAIDRVKNNIEGSQKVSP